MDLPLLCRIYWVAAALFFCHVGYGFFTILRAIPEASALQALFELIPAALLAAIAIRLLHPFLHHAGYVSGNSIGYGLGHAGHQHHRPGNRRKDNTAHQQNCGEVISQQAHQ